MNAVMSKLPTLVYEEYDAANKAHPAFASLHEGYAVLIEERDEARDELLLLNEHIKLMWAYIKRDDEQKAKATAENIQQTAMRLAAEAIQVAAMARKIRYGADPGKGGGIIDPPTKTPSERRRRPAEVFSK